MKKLLVLASLLGLAVALTMGPAQATIITQGVSTYPFPNPSAYAFPSGSLIDFTDYTYAGMLTNGPEVVYNSGGVSVTLTVDPTATNGNAFLGGGYWNLQDPATLDGNGYWGTNPGDLIRYAGMMGNTPASSGVGSLIFTFNTPVQAVGSFMNYWLKAGATTGPDVTIAALGQTGNVLDIYNISRDYPISTPGAIDQGAFRGIYRSEGDIYSFVVSNSYAVLSDLRFDAVPLPPSVLLLGSGLLALVGLRKRFIK